MPQEDSVLTIAARGRTSHLLVGPTRIIDGYSKLTALSFRLKKRNDTVVSHSVKGNVSEFRIIKCMLELSAGGFVQWQVIKCSVLTDDLSELSGEQRRSE